MNESQFAKMFSMDNFEFEALMNRPLFDGQHTNTSTTSSSSSTDFYLCEDLSSDSDLYCGFNSDQENTDCDKL